MTNTRPLPSQLHLDCNTCLLHENGINIVNKHFDFQVWNATVIYGSDRAMHCYTWTNCSTNHLPELIFGQTLPKFKWTELSTIFEHYNQNYVLYVFGLHLGNIQTFTAISWKLEEESAPQTRYDYNLPIIKSSKRTPNTQMSSSFQAIKTSVTYSPVSVNECVLSKTTIILWFRGRDLNGFWDIKPYMNCRGIPRGTPISVNKCVLS